ncbi:hypothetical protein AB3R30_14365 [Leptolyngbyaceae cyanobacterium UHCC 1019]
MIDLPHNSIDAATQAAVSHAANLLHHYSFELDVTVEQQMAAWLKTYPAQWILLSVVEALYQGRYKAVSVEQILHIWQRRGQPLCHFTHEFERLVRSEIPAAIAPPSNPEIQPEPLPQPTLSYRTMLLQLPSVKAASRLKRLTEIPSLTFPLNGETDLSGQSQAQNLVRRTTITSSHSVDLPAVAELISQPVSGGEAIASTSHLFESNALESSSNKPRLPGESDRDFQQFKEGVIFALSSGLSNPTLHPVIRLHLIQYYRLDWHYFIDSQAPCV